MHLKVAKLTAFEARDSCANKAETVYTDTTLLVLWV